MFKSFQSHACVSYVTICAAAMQLMTVPSAPSLGLLLLPCQQGLMLQTEQEVLLQEDGHHICAAAVPASWLQPLLLGSLGQCWLRWQSPVPASCKDAVSSVQQLLQKTLRGLQSHPRHTSGRQRNSVSCRHTPGIWLLARKLLLADDT